jgi:AcrR family transcriptional regulator
VSEQKTARHPRPAAQRVREAAKELFYRQGIRATGVEEVCRVAGATKMSLYRAYPSKDALVEAILREDCEEAACWYGCAVHGSLSPAERPMAFVQAAARALREPGFRGCPLGMAIVEFPEADHPIRKLADSQKLLERETLRHLCAEAGLPEPDVLGDALMLLIEGAFTAAPYLGNEEAARVLEASAQALFAAAACGGV